MLTDAQLVVFKAALLAEVNPELVSYRENGQTPLIAAWYNQEKTPAVVVWKTSVTQDEVMQNGFDWVQVDNLTGGGARIWEWLFNNSTRSINPSKLNVRAGIDECWKGTAAKVAVRDAVYIHCKRNVTRGEALYTQGTGTTLSPSIMGFEGQITEYDVTRALALV